MQFTHRDCTHLDVIVTNVIFCLWHNGRNLHNRSKMLTVTEKCGCRRENIARWFREIFSILLEDFILEFEIDFHQLWGKNRRTGGVEFHRFGGQYINISSHMLAITFPNHHVPIKKAYAAIFKAMLTWKLHGPLTFSLPPTSKETTSYRFRHALRHVRHVMHVGITNPRWFLVGGCGHQPYTTRLVRRPAIYTATQS